LWALLHAVADDVDDATLYVLWTRAAAKPLTGEKLRAVSSVALRSPAPCPLPLTKSQMCGRKSGWRYVCMYVKIRRHQHTRVHAHTGPRRHTRAPACHRHHIHIPRLVRRQAFHTDHHSSPSLCDRPRGGGGRGAARKLLGLEPAARLGL